MWFKHAYQSMTFEASSDDDARTKAKQITEDLTQKAQKSGSKTIYEVNSLYRLGVRVIRQRTQDWIPLEAEH